MKPFPALRQPRSILITTAAVLLWILSNAARPYVLKTTCTGGPQSPAFGCHPQELNRIDRTSLGIDRTDADLLSYYTQNFAGAAALAIPLAYTAWVTALGVLPGSLVVITVSYQLQVLLETMAWNGLALEISHFLTSKPRPFVFADTTGQAGDPQNYTSFYSGHTSFTAAMMTAALLLLLTQGASLRWLIVAGTLGQALVLLTAIFRVLGARHFPTDVVSGAIAGSLVSVGVAISFRSTWRTRASVKRRGAT